MNVNMALTGRRNKMEEIIKKAVKNEISNKIDEMITSETQRFYNKLTDMKDEYIAEIMRGIRICHERDEMGYMINYRIVFENIVRLENKIQQESKE